MQAIPPPTRHQRPWYIRYAVAAGCVLAAAGVCATSAEFSGAHFPFVLFVLAALISAWYGGLAAGLVALTAGYLLGDYVFLHPPGTSEHHGHGEVMLLLTYAVTTLIAVLLVEGLRREHRVAQAAAWQAQHRNRQLEWEIAERHRAEQTRAEAEAKYRCLVEESLVGVYLIQDGRFVYVNARLAEIFGYRQEEVAGRPVGELVAPEHRPMVVENVRKREAGELHRIQYVFHGLRRDGQVIDVEVIGTESVYNGRPAVLGSLLDITERRRAEEAMRLSEERFRRTFDESPIGAAIVTLDRRYQRVNDAFCRLVGYSREELAALRIEQITHPDDIATDMGFAERMARGEIEQSETDKRYLRKDGATVWVHVSARLLRDAAGHPLYFLPMMQDITARRLAEAQLRQAKEAAEAANEAKDRFLAVLSHELRTPLTPVLAATGLMLQDGGDLPPDVADHLQMIQRNVQLEATLIDDLLDVNRIARGKIELSVQTLDVRSVLRRTVEICSADIAAKDLRLTLDMDKGPSYLRGDPARLQQVFWNLLRNAIKFTPEGGRIAVRCAGGAGAVSRVAGSDCTPPDVCPVACGCEYKVRSLLVEVRDSGMGMEPAQIRRLFRAFEQGGRDVTRQFGGLGLGLVISKALVELHGGSITAASDGPGQGATFRVELPLCGPVLPACGSECLTFLVPSLPERSQSPAPAEPSGADQKGSAAAQILLVEDHVDTARTMARLLRAKGYVVQVAHDVAGALELSTRDRFDLVISDLGLPDGSGLDLIRQLRAVRHDLPSVALSGYGMEEDIRRSREAGFDLHLIKPVGIQQIHTALARLLSDQRHAPSAVAAPARLP